MRNTAQFKTKEQLACEAFIADAKQLKLFDPNISGHLEWDENSWNISAFITKTSAIKYGTVSFCAYRQRKNAKAMAQPLCDTAKALVAHKLWANHGAPKGISPYKDISAAAKSLDRVMSEDGLANGDPTRLTHAILEEAVDITSEGLKRPVAIVLRTIADTLHQAGITRNLPEFYHPASRKKKTRLPHQPQKGPGQPDQRRGFCPSEGLSCGQEPVRSDDHRSTRPSLLSAWPDQ